MMRLEIIVLFMLQKMEWYTIKMHLVRTFA